MRHSPERHAPVEMGVVDAIEVQPGAPPAQREVLKGEAVQPLRLDDRGEAMEPLVVRCNRRGCGGRHHTISEPSATAPARRSRGGAGTIRVSRTSVAAASIAPLWRRAPPRCVSACSRRAQNSSTAWRCETVSVATICGQKVSIS
jgi:hypothetical protein